MIVLGHSGCGAVLAAVDVLLNPADYLLLATVRFLRGFGPFAGRCSGFGTQAPVGLRGRCSASQGIPLVPLWSSAIITNAAWSAYEIRPMGKAVSRLYMVLLAPEPGRVDAANGSAVRNQIGCSAKPRRLLRTAWRRRHAIFTHCGLARLAPPPPTGQ